MVDSVWHGLSQDPDPRRAVAELRSQIKDLGLDVLFFFCSPDYDLDEVGEELKRSFNCPIIGCTSSGQLGPVGFQKGGMSATGFGGGNLAMVPHLIHPLVEFQDQVLRIASSIHEAAPSGRNHAFGFLVIDGLSMMEERVTSAIYQALENIPIIGGSAGDDLRFARTFVYFDGKFLSDAAVLASFRARGPVVPFMLKHFIPGEQNLVITDADTDRRILREINGEPAAEVYARTLGVPLEDLGPEVFSRHPLIMAIGSDHHVRSIAKALPDRALALYCAIDTGLVISIGKSVDPFELLDRALSEARRKAGDPFAVLACDCILRRLEFENIGSDREVGELMARNQVFGFSTYGEQFNGIHVNQTLTGIVLGRPGGA
ncbi:MAG: histidine kinase [Holophaga sp.]|nr:histidine kinase [Holophaga sp.]